ncbi:hypothetical protein H6F88_16125 [Oculatella sp. FACHB-28]|uniref:hypothetical protein n=1 Tax=Oculatella sp. FACHB-28 TaxID=2692845 RepID=UPI001683E6C7|nr:hypothetical protein [Oculatella sp. FACHB-28]MBD2057530.1 hypothetical protein [Oculatella sp. FACHB-28]
MVMQNEAVFEIPASHEVSQYSNPFSTAEYENEWEMQEASQYNLEYESEWEQEASQYNPEYESEWEQEASQYNPEYESEWEMQEASQYNPEYENEWEMQEASLYNPEFEDEGEYFFKKLGRGLKSLAKVAAPIAKRLAPIAARTLVGMIPGVGAVAGPLAGKLTSALLKEGEMEAAQLEAQLFGTNEFEAEVANTEIAHEAALTEVLAAQAAEAATEAEAEAAAAAALPITITIMGGQRALRPVTPILAQANGRLVKTLRQQGKVGKQLLRTVPAIQRRTVATLKAASRAGKPITGAMAVKAMAASAQQVLNNPRTVQRSITRNAVLRQRVAPSNPRRAAAQAARCPSCASKRAVR